MMRTVKAITGILGMALGIGGVLLALSMDRVFSSSGIFSWGARQDRTVIAALVVLSLAVFLAAYGFTIHGLRR